MKLRIPTNYDYNMSDAEAASIDNFVTISDDGSIKLIKQFSTKSRETNDYKCQLGIIKSDQANIKTSKIFFYL